MYIISHEYIYIFFSLKYEWNASPLFIFTESVHHSCVIVCVQINKAQHCSSPLVKAQSVTAPALQHKSLTSPEQAAA